MRLVALFSDHTDYIKRTRVGDVVLVGRENAGKVNTVGSYVCTGLNPLGAPILRKISQEELQEKIAAADKLNLELIGHSSKGGKMIQSDSTPRYSKQHIGIDKIAAWLEGDVFRRGNISRATISFLSCEAADGSAKTPPLAEQLFKLLETKPLKVTARKGFVYIENHIYSLNSFRTMIERGQEQKHPIAQFFAPPKKETSMNEKFAYFSSDNDPNVLMKLDKQLYDLYQLTKKNPQTSSQPEIEFIINKKIEQITAAEFRTLAQFGRETDPEGKLFKKALRVLTGGTIEVADEVGTNMSSFYMRDRLLNAIYFLKEEAQGEKYSALSQLLNETTEFIEYRQLRNYPIHQFFDILEILEKGIRNDGVITPENQEKLHALSSSFRSKKHISADINERITATGLRAPSFRKEVAEVTSKKNNEYADRIDHFLTSPEPNLSNLA